MNVEEIAKSISQLENMPEDDRFFESCVLVAENVYELDEETAYKVAEIIQEKYLY